MCVSKYTYDVYVRPQGSGVMCAASHPRSDAAGLPPPGYRGITTMNVRAAMNDCPPPWPALLATLGVGGDGGGGCHTLYPVAAATTCMGQKAFVGCSWEPFLSYLHASVCVTIDGAIHWYFSIRCVAYDKAPPLPHARALPGITLTPCWPSTPSHSRPLTTNPHAPCLRTACRGYSFYQLVHSTK